MKQRTRFTIVLAMAGLLLIISLAQSVAAQTGGDYAITWFSINGGAGAGAGDDYALNGVAGQPHAGPMLSGGEYALIGDLWPGAYPPVTPYRIFLPLLLHH